MCVRVCLTAYGKGCNEASLKICGVFLLATSHVSKRTVFEASVRRATNASKMSADFDNNSGESSIMSSIIKEVSTIKDKLKSKEEDWECELASFATQLELS